MTRTCLIGLLRLIAVPLLCSVGASCALASVQGSLVGVTSGFVPGSAPFVSIDPDTGVYTTLSTAARSHNALAADSSGDLYASWFSGSGDQGRVSRIDPNTGVIIETFNAVTPGAGDIRGLAFDGADTLYAVVNRNDQFGAPTLPDDLYTIDLDSETTTLVGSLGFMSVQGLDFSPSGDLVAWDIGDGLLEVDPLTGAAVDAGPTDGSPLIQSIAFAPDGALYGAGPRLFELNPADGSVISAGPSGGPDVRGIEWVVPEPSTSVGAAVLTALACLCRRRFIGS